MYSYCDLFLGVATTTWYDSTRKQHILILGFVIYFNPIHYFFFCCFIINSLDCKLDCCLKMSTSSFLNMVLYIGMESFHAIAIFNRSISSSWNNFFDYCRPISGILLKRVYLGNFDKLFPPFPKALWDRMWFFSWWFRGRSFWRETLVLKHNPTPNLTNMC